MADVNRVLTAFRNELETAGLIRRPSLTGSALPPLFVEPRDGPPAPGGRQAPETTGELVVTIRLAGQLAEPPFGSYRRRVVVDVIYRTSTTAGLQASRVLDAAIQQRIVKPADYGQGIMLDAAGTSPTSVLQATQFGGLGPVAQDDGVRTERSAYLFEVLAP